MKNFAILKSKKVIFSFIAIFLVTSAALAENPTIKIGVLAKRGPERCMERWSPTAEYLSNKIPGKTFKIVPIDFDHVYSMVEKSEVDFILANPSFYVELENYYGISRIATLKNKVLSGIHTTFGGVVFCKEQRNDIRYLINLKDKTFMAVKETSFGGWRTAWRELKEAGINPFKDFASLSFGGSHDAVVYAVQDGKVDAGTVRTDTLERMDAEGKIRMDNFYIIHEHVGENVPLPFLHSTREYPEWPIAKLKHTANELAEKVSAELINMPENAVAAQTARCAGWTIPLNYQSVHDCLKELKVGPYKDLGKITLTDVFKKYWVLILIVLAAFVATTLFLFINIMLSKKVRTANKELEIEIDERIQAGKALQESEEKFRSFSEQSIVGVYLIQDEKFVYVNPKFADIFGYSVEECLNNMHFQELIHPDDLALVQEQVRRRVAGEISFLQYKFRGIKENNEIIHVEIYGSSIPYKGGKAATGTVLDITEGKHSAEALQKSENQLRSIIEHSSELFYIHDTSHVLTYVSPTSEAVLGYTPEEMKRKWTDLTTDNPLNLKGVEITENAIKTGKKQKSYLLELKKKDGSFVLVEIDESPVKDATGKVVGMTGALRDVTLQKQTRDRLIKSEQRFRALFNAINDIIYTHDIEGCFTSANPAMCKAFGHKPDELIGRPVSDFMKPEFVSSFKNEYLEVIKKKGRQEGTAIYYKKNGEKFYIEYRSALVRPEDGKPFISGTGRDVTEKVLSAKKVGKLQEQLAQAQKMESVGRLAGGVAHDYNNALSAIMGFTELAMTKADPSGKIHDDLNEILKAAKRAAAITRQLLAFARRQTIAPEVLDLNKNVENMLKMLRRLIGEDIDLAWLPGTDLWPVKVDPSQIDQVLANLSVNARDAIEGVGKITIETGTVTLDKAYCANHTGFAPGEFVLLVISDNGCGMDKEILDNIFEPFFTTKDANRGTGLGLAMVYGIVKQNNGFINVYSEPGKGTAVKIYLPRYEGNIVYTPRKSTTETLEGSGEIVLLVEDDLPILKLSEKMLQGLGYTMLIAATPNEALELVEEHAGKIHLLITDVIMPEMNGCELAERLQSFHPELKCMFMSGYTANAIAHHGVLDEGVHFIQKPFSKKDLSKAVRKVLDE